MFNVNLNDSDGAVVFVFEGKMDGLQVKEIENQVAAELKGKMVSGGKVVFDLSSVSYIASAFIRLCVACAKAAGDGNFSVINTNPLIKKTFKIAGLETVLNVK